MKPELTVDCSIIESSSHEGSASVISPVGGGVKRVVDVFIASVAILLLLPLMATLLFLIWCHDRKNPIFLHRRIGLGGRTFHCLKFRSMAPNSSQLLNELLKTNAEAAKEWKEKQKLQTDPRITPIGKVLRASSLDELPQLLNVLKGEMSIVGPRPIVPEEVERYGSDFHRYCACRPGLTGLWQVSGRSDCSYRERVDCDIRYASDWSLRNDFIVMLKTVPAVLLRKGSY